MTDRNHIFQYYSFISYNKADRKWAELLQKKLDSYKVPSVIRNSFPDLPDKVSPVFRDQTDLDSGILLDEIKKALDNSKYLIVICSPFSSSSLWVNKEVEYFISLGRIEFVIPLIVDGEPNSLDPALECFPPGLKKLTEGQELLGVNINDMGRDAAYMKVISRMLRIPFDEIWDRQKRMQKLRRRTVTTILVLFILFLISIIGYVNSLNKSLRINHSRFVAEKAEELVQDIGTVSALKMLLEVAPPKYPYTFEVEKAIRMINKQHTQEDYSLINQLTMEDKPLVASLLPTGVGIVVFTENSVKIYSDLSLRIEDSFPCKIGKRVFWDGSEDEKICFATSEDSLYTCEIKDLSFETFNKIGFHKGIKDIVFLEEAGTIVSFSEKEAKLWDFETGNYLTNLILEQDSFNQAAVSESGLLCVNSGKGHILIYDLLHFHLEPLVTVSLPKTSISSVAFIPEQESVICSTTDNDLCVIHNINSQCVTPHYLQHSMIRIDYVMTDPNGKYLISVSDKFMRIWDLESMQEMPYSPIDNVGAITTLSVDSNSQNVVTGAFDGKIRLWSLKTGKNIVTYPHGKWVYSIDFSDNGERIVSVADDMSVRLWNGVIHKAETAEAYETISSNSIYEDNGGSIISPNGEYSVNVHNDEIHIEELKSKDVVICKGHRGKINSVAFSPDSRMLVSGGIDMTVRVWSVENGKEISPIMEGHNRPILKVGFSDDMTYIASVSSDRTKRIWPFISYTSLLKTYSEVLEDVVLSENDMKRCYLK